MALFSPEYIFTAKRGLKKLRCKKRAYKTPIRFFLDLFRQKNTQKPLLYVSFHYDGKRCLRSPFCFNMDISVSILARNIFEKSTLSEIVVLRSSVIENIFTRENSSGGFLEATDLDPQWYHTKLENYMQNQLTLPQVWIQ